MSASRFGHCRHEPRDACSKDRMAALAAVGTALFNGECARYFVAERGGRWCGSRGEDEQEAAARDQPQGCERYDGDE